MRFRPQNRAVFASSLVLVIGLIVSPGRMLADEVRPGLTPVALDTLVSKQVGAVADEQLAGDATFLRRLTFDLIGRQPTAEEQRGFESDASPDRDARTIERLLASPEFGVNWANYWCDTIAYRVPPPELTYLNYAPLKTWLTEKLNANVPWTLVVRELITAQGKVDEVPAATFVGYHAADATNLAGETSRIFLGQQIGCAQCHDHPFDHWKRKQFHELAAFFARTKVKLSQNDGGGTVVSALDKGEYLLPDTQDPRKKGNRMMPAVLEGEPLEKNLSDAERRTRLADWITARDNPWFAKAFTNRIWSRTMGGFYEPVDDLGDSARPVWPEVHEALAAQFTASGYDIKNLLRLIVSSGSYRRGIRPEMEQTPGVVLAEAPLRLRGDEIFAALNVGLGLPNFTPPKVAPTAAVRFPPPPKSTRDLVVDAFGTDPSLAAVDAPRTMAQALWMMNNEQLQKQIDAKPGSDTLLSQILANQADDTAACRELYTRVLARQPSERELKVVLEHVGEVKDRGQAFEDILWSLVNTAEFTSRR